MADLKKKFFDILFEDDEDDNLDIQEKYIDDSDNTNAILSAKDILYRKPSSSLFIDLEEKNKQENSVVNDDIAKQEKLLEEYEMSTRISPIFGIVGEPKQKKVRINTQDDSLINKPVDSHLDIITSPIFGYGKQESSSYETFDDTLEIKQESEDEQLHHLFDQDSINNDTNSDDEISLVRLFGEDR